MNRIEPIQPADDARMAALVRENLEGYGLALPGTAYFDPELDHLSRYYDADREKRAYFVLKDGTGRVLGGVGIAELDGLERCAELQKLYLADEVKGRGLGRRLLEAAEDAARQRGYRQLYLETHSALKEAVGLYIRASFRSIAKPEFVLHSTMDRFFLKTL